MTGHPDELKLAVIRIGSHRGLVKCVADAEVVDELGNALDLGRHALLVWAFIGQLKVGRIAHAVDELFDVVISNEYHIFRRVVDYPVEGRHEAAYSSIGDDEKVIDTGGSIRSFFFLSYDVGTIFKLVLRQNLVRSAVRHTVDVKRSILTHSSCSCGACS